LVDGGELATAQQKCDLVACRVAGAGRILPPTSGPVIHEWRESKGLPKNPMEAFRQSGYLERITKERAARNLAERLLLCVTALILNSTQEALSSVRLRRTRVDGPSWRIFSREFSRRRRFTAFPNEPVEYAGGSLHWDMPRLWLEVRRAFVAIGGSRTGGHRGRRVGRGLCLAGRARRVA
jgi:hypothetical protein